MASHGFGRSVALLGMVGCGGAASPPSSALLSNQTLPPRRALSTVLAAVQASGPWESIEAFCAMAIAAVNEPGGDGGDGPECGTHYVDQRGSVAPFEDVIALQVSGPSEPHDVACVVGVQGADGWYFSAPSAEVCFERRYIETSDARAEAVTGGAGPAIAVHLDVSWHTSDHDDSSRYTVTTLCGMKDGVPACTPLFKSACEDDAPAGDCGDVDYQLTWSVAGGVLSVVVPAGVTGAEQTRLSGDHALGL